MKYIQLDFKKCKNGVSCQTDTNINTMLKNGQVYLSFKMNYFDFNDYQTPLKPVINDRYSFRIVQGFTKIVTMYLK